MTLRVVFACGLTELMTYRVFLSELALPPADRTTLVLYGRTISMPARHLTETRARARLFGDWSHIIDITDQSDALARESNADLRCTVGEHVADLLRVADEIFVHTLWKRIERSFLDACPDAQVYVFDNGLDSHLDRRIVRPGETGLKDGDIRVADLARVERAMFTLGDMIDPPGFMAQMPVIVPGASVMREQFAALAARLSSDGPLNSIGHEARTALFLGTSFFRRPDVEFEEEKSIYDRAMAAAQRAGFRAMVKDHPRTPRPMLERDGADIAPLSASIPIECIAVRARIDATASISSTALLTMKKAFGIPCALLGGDATFAASLPWAGALRRHAAPIEELFAG